MHPGISAAARAFWRMIDLVMALLLAALIVLVFANVVMRYGFSSGLRVTIELSRLWFVWVVMLGAAVMLRRGEHLKLSEFSEAVMPRFVPILRRICWAVVLIAVLMLFVGAWRQTLDPRPKRLDLGGNLVPQDHRLAQAHRAEAAVIGVMQVRSADPPAFQPQTHLPRRGHRIGALLDPQVMGGVDDKRAHHDTMVNI